MHFIFELHEVFLPEPSSFTAFSNTTCYVVRLSFVYTDSNICLTSILDSFSGTFSVTPWVPQFISIHLYTISCAKWAQTLHFVSFCYQYRILMNKINLLSYAKEYSDKANLPFSSVKS